MGKPRIAEYKQIDTEIITNTIMVDDYDEEGNIIGQHEETVTKEVPIMGLVYRDMTDEEVAEQQKAELEQAMNVQPTTIEEKMQMLAESITETLPSEATNNDGMIQLPLKVGYKWEKKLVGNNIVYESVADPNAIGTEQNPIIHTADAPLINNAFYKKDGGIYVYMSGEFVDWSI